MGPGVGSRLGTEDAPGEGAEVGVIAISMVTAPMYTGSSTPSAQAGVTVKELTPESASKVGLSEDEVPQILVSLQPTLLVPSVKVPFSISNIHRSLVSLSSTVKDSPDPNSNTVTSTELGMKGGRVSTSERTVQVSFLPKGSLRSNS